MDWRDARALFPSVDKTVYLNTAGGGPGSKPSAAAARAYYEQSLADGDIHWDAWLERVESVRARLAGFLNGAPANIAFTANAPAIADFSEGFPARAGLLSTSPSPTMRRPRLA